MEQSDYFKEMHSSIKASIEENSLDRKAIYNYVMHIPFKGIQEGWPEEIYSAGLLLLEDLYNYSKEKGYVNGNLFLEEFISEVIGWGREKYYKSS